MSDEKIFATRYWQSLRQRELTHDEAADSWREFEEGVDPAAMPKDLIARISADVEAQLLKNRATPAHETTSAHWQAKGRELRAAQQQRKAKAG